MTLSEDRGYLSAATFPKEESDERAAYIQEEQDLPLHHLSPHYPRGLVEVTDDEGHSDDAVLCEESQPESEPPYWHHVSRLEVNTHQPTAKSRCRGLIPGFLLGMLVMVIVLSGTQLHRATHLTPLNDSGPTTDAANHEPGNLLDHEGPAGVYTQDGGLHLSRGQDDERQEQLPGPDSGTGQDRDGRQGGSAGDAGATGIRGAGQPGTVSQAKTFRPLSSAKLPTLPKDYWRILYGYEGEDEYNDDAQK